MRKFASNDLTPVCIRQAQPLSFRRGEQYRVKGYIEGLLLHVFSSPSPQEGFRVR